MAMNHQKPDAGKRRFCRTCGEEIRWTGQRWTHDARYSDGHPALPMEPRMQDVNLRIKAGAVADETFDLRGTSNPAELQILAEDAADGKKKLPTFNMTAYTGGPMNPGGWYRAEPIVVDLAGMKIPSQKLPIDKDHGTLVGHSTSIEMTPGQTKLKCKGVLSGYDEESDDIEAQAARRIVRMSKNEFPYQASIDAQVTKLERIEAGEKCNVNGQSLTGPLYVARASTLRGVAILAAGADGNTETKIAAKIGSAPMNPEFRAWLKASGDYTDAEIDALKPKQVTLMQAAWEKSTAPPPPVAQPVKAGAGDPPAKTAEQIEEDRIRARRRADAVEDERIAAIRAVCAKYPGLSTLIDDPEKPGTDKSVPILSHAIAEGWTARQAELQCKREARPAGPIGVFAHSHDEDCTLEALQCAMMLRSDPKNKPGGPQKDILAHPVYQTPMALNVIINAQGKQQEMIPAFLRAGLNADARQKAMESAWKYRDMSVVDLCAECLRLDGRDVPRNRELRVQAAFSGAALTSIFTTNINTIMLATYSEADDYTEGWTSTAEVNDYKLNERPRMQKGGPLSKQPRGGEADHTTRSDTEESYKIQRYSRQFDYDEMDAIDDHWNMLADIPIEMGNASGRMRPSLVTAILLSNPTLAGPNIALFDNATNGNKLFSQTLALGTFQAACVALRKFRENGVNLNLEPTHVIVPADLDFLIDQILHSGLVVSGNTTAIGNVNTTIKVKAEPRPTPYLSNGVVDPDSGTTYSGSTSTWYLASNKAHIIEVGYLKGSGRAPQMRSWMLSQGKFGIGYDVNLSVGAKALDWRGIIQNVTAAS